MTLSEGVTWHKYKSVHCGGWIVTTSQRFFFQDYLDSFCQYLSEKKKKICIMKVQL